MKTRRPKHESKHQGLEKCPTGIEGIDQITQGGLPRGRATLIAGGAGSGKSVLAMEFLVHGARRFGEPGLLVSFEETPEEICTNFASFGFELPALRERGLVAIEHIRIDRSEIEETGEYSLEGLFILLAGAIEAIGAKRIVLDTIEVLFSGFSNRTILRSELQRLLRWLKQQRLTAIVTSERGAGSLSGKGLEDFVSDCVIYLDHRVTEQVSTRRLRIVKYRGSAHGSNEYPFLIENHGVWVFPVTSVGLDYEVSKERIPTGVRELDEMLDGKGYFRGSTILISGTAGTGKSSTAAHFVDATCRRGEKGIYFALEESRHQLVRNMRSLGIDLKTWVDTGQLQIHAARPTLFGIEMHLVTMHRLVETFAPQVVIVDPISSFAASCSVEEIKAMLVRLIDVMKQRGTTAVFTMLTPPAAMSDADIGISSLVDTWLEVRDFELAGGRHHGLCIVKSRGMAHSNEVRELLITSTGVELRDMPDAARRILVGKREVHTGLLRGRGGPGDVGGPRPPEDGL